jgi:RimJ/RimL family protein N-acetyltransferase
MLNPHPAELNAAERAALAGSLGDTPETAASIHLLRRGLARAVVAGTPERPRAAVVQSLLDPSEPTAFGDDAGSLWSLLRDLDGWEAVNVPLAVGPPLSALIEAATGYPGKLNEEIYYVLDHPVVAATHPAVRRLTLADLPLLEAATEPLEMEGWSFGSAAALLADGYVAGAVIDGQLVAVAFTGSFSDRHAGIGVVTHEAWRGRGLSTATAALVCADVQAAGLTPVWSTAIYNVPSQRVATKLGFVEVARRVYVNRF